MLEGGEDGRDGEDEPMFEEPVEDLSNDETEVVDLGLTPQERERERLLTEVATAKETLESAQQRLRTVSRAYTDLQAEMTSFRERMEARSTLTSELQAFQMAKTFFDPVMNLKRSLVAGNEGESLAQGLKMVHHQFMEAMRSLGLEEVPGEGAPFDPNLHEALAISPVDDATLDGKVLVVHTAGYSVKGKVLQAAQVVIGKLQDGTGEA